jgi:hypothetical protein
MANAVILVNRGWLVRILLWGAKIVTWLLVLLPKDGQGEPRLHLDPAGYTLYVEGRGLVKEGEEFLNRYIENRRRNDQLVFEERRVGHS